MDELLMAICGWYLCLYTASSQNVTDFYIYISLFGRYFYPKLSLVVSANAQTNVPVCMLHLRVT